MGVGRETERAGGLDGTTDLKLGGEPEAHLHGVYLAAREVDAALLLVRFAAALGAPGVLVAFDPVVVVTDGGKVGASGVGMRGVGFPVAGRHREEGTYCERECWELVAEHNFTG